MLNSLKTMEDFYTKYPKLCFWFFAVLFILPVSFIKIYDIDIWWHMQSGKSVLTHFAWPDFSDFYFSPVSMITGSLRGTFLGDIIFHLVYIISGDFGLQMMRIGAVLTACFLLRSMAGKEYKGWHLLLLMVLVVGTYQKQLVRNSLYAYYLVPVLFWLWYQICKKEKSYWYLWLYPFILGVWSCLHGSYLLGFCLVALIFVGDVIDKIRQRQPGLGRQILVYISVLVLSLGMISAWNPTTLSYLKLSRWVNAPQTTPKKDINSRAIDDYVLNKKIIDSQENQLIKHPELSIKISDFVSVKKEKTGSLSSLKRWLNNTVFKTSGSPVQSADFLSPFDRLDRLYVWVSLLCGMLGLGLTLFFIQPVRYSLFLPFLGVLFVGVGYLRLCGYIPMVTAALVFFSAGENRIRCLGRKEFRSKLTWSLSFLLILLIWINCVLQFPIKLGSSYHAFGMGRIPTFSEKCADTVYSEFKANNVFTTMTTGGYLLYRWFPKKKVFIDGFFAPHPPKVLLHLRILREKNINPDFLFTEYGIDVALIDHTSGSIMNNFFNSENWYVQYIDTGMVCFVYQPDFSADIKVPEVLFDGQDLDSLPDMFKSLTVNSLHTIVNALYKKGRSKDGEEFYNTNAFLLKRTTHVVDPAFISITEQLRLNGQAVYGVSNTKTQYYEYKHNAAIENKNMDETIEYGLMVIKNAPDRFPIIMNLAIAYLKMGRINTSLEMLNKLENGTTASNAYRSQNKRNISKFYWELSKRVRKDNEHIKAYFLAQKAHEMDPALILTDKLYQTAMEDISKLNQQGYQKVALTLLDSMESRFGESARWLNDMAWQILISGGNSPFELGRAEGYSKKAVEMMENENSKLLDLAYDTLALIVFRQGKKEEACIYIHKALTAAPENRKSEYGNRPECER